MNYATTISIQLDDIALKMKKLLNQIYIISDKLDELSEKFGIDLTAPTLQLELMEIDFLYKLAPRIKIHAYKEVNPGESDTIFEWDLIKNGYSKKHMLIITHVANTRYADTYLEWHRDYSGAPDFRREEVEKIEYAYSNLDNPKELLPWVPIFSNHKWVAYNNDSVPHVFEVLMYGFIFPREYFMRIMDKIWR